MRRLITLALALAIGLVARTAEASTITYTFESPNFTVGQTTPLLNKAPNVGPATFLTSFTDAVDPAGYVIDNAFVPNNLMLGQILYAPTVSSPLTLTFNQAVTSLSLSFAINGAAVTSLLRLTTSSGGVLDTFSATVGGAFPGGTVNFTGAPFTSATLQGFVVTGANTQIAIDNLTLETAAVPEPSTFVLLGIGGTLLVGRRIARRK